MKLRENEICFSESLSLSDDFQQNANKVYFETLDQNLTLLSL